MFNSETLEVGIGMAFLFLLMSLICTGIKEWLESLLKWRAMDLERALRTLLDDNKGELSAYFFSHPLISSLFQGKYDPSRLKKSTLQRWFNDTDAMHMPLSARRNLPSYIPSDQFAKALMDIVGRGPASVDGEDPPQLLTLEQLRERAAALRSTVLRRVLLTAIDHADGNLKQATDNLQHWFDSAMDRASGWYKRRTQTILFILGLSAAAILNVDSLYIMGRLTADKTFREAVLNAAAKAQDPAAANAAAQDGLRVAQQARKELNDIGMPMGWAEDKNWPMELRPIQFQACDPKTVPNCASMKMPSLYSVVRLLLGWLISAFAVMLGAPFWFDVLNKFMVVRSTVKPREKSREEDSKDREDDATRAAQENAENNQNNPPPHPPPGNELQNNVLQPNTSQAPLSFVPHSWRDGKTNTTEIPL